MKRTQANMPVIPCFGNSIGLWFSSAYLAYVSCCSSPKEFAPTSQTFALSNGSGDEVRSDLVCALQPRLFHGKKPLISLVDSISGQTGGTTPNGAMKT